MKLSLTAICLSLAGICCADDLDSLPDEVVTLVEEKGELLLSDDFDREDADDRDDLGDAWQTNSRNRAQGDKQTDLVDGVLEMTISPKADHAISVVHNTSEPYADAVTLVRFRLEEGGQLKLAFNDREFKEVHAGHINGVTIRPNRIVLADERSGRFGTAAYAIKDDPSRAAERTAIIRNTELVEALDLATDEWHEIVTLHRGTTLTAWIDGEEVASFDSPGFGHETRRQFVFAVPKAADVDFIRLWSLSGE